jgi:methylamine dehydrogenase heavy chain
MQRHNIMKRLILLTLIFASSAFGQVQPEPTGVIQTLPAPWPAHWIIAHDVAFFHMSDGKFYVLDAESDDAATRVKGIFNGAFIAQFIQATSRPEMYILETFRSRGSRGERTDVLTIYGKDSLAPIGEVVIPPKRASAMPTNYHLQLVDDEKLALIYNFTPATSVSVVDIVNREFLGEIPIPGCSLVYPMAGRAFASLCTDGSMMSVQLDENGEQASTARTGEFFDANDDPIMEKAAMIDGVAYFPTFLGRVVPVDLNGSEPEVGQEWSLLGDGDEGWRPGGIQVTERDSDGRMYVLMHPDGYEGSHKDPGTEVWVFDVANKRRVDRIELQLPAISMGMTNDDDPLLVVTNVNLELDIYAAKSGEYQRTLNNFAAETVLMLYGAE